MKSPSYSISRILKTADKFEDAIMDSCTMGSQLSSEEYERLANVLAGMLKPHKDADFTARVHAVKSVLFYCVGDEMTEGRVWELARVLGGWSTQLAKGVEYRQWRGNKNTWAALHVEDVQNCFCTPPRFNCSLYSYSGASSGLFWEQQLSKSFLLFLIKQIGGLKRERYSPEDINGLWFTAAIKQAKGKLQMEHIQVNSSQLKHNRTVLKARKGMCIREEFSGRQCFNCGLGTDKCALSRHRSTYPFKPCKNIKPFKHKGWIVRDGYCILCTAKIPRLKMFKSEKNES